MEGESYSSQVASFPGSPDLSRVSLGTRLVPRHSKHWPRCETGSHPAH